VVRVFHCDDSHAYRRLIRAVLQTEESIELVGEADRYETLMAGLADARPDVLLLDMVRGVTDSDVAAALRETAPGVAVIILSGHHPDAVDPGIREVAAAHVMKSTSFDELARTIRAAGVRTNVE
jgi:DNA-binding NarL/FixJ family response regulator